MKKYFILLSSFLLLSCNFFQKKENNSTVKGPNFEEITEDSSQEETFTREIIEGDFSVEDFPIKIVKISKEDFLSAKDKAPALRDSIQKITDLQVVSNLLKDVVEFSLDENGNTTDFVKKINYRSGVSETFDDEYSDNYFVAYFPTEDILLCEGGHSSDISYSLQNGKNQYEIGNPDYIIASPQNTIRVNGSFGGQECIDYFIQQYRNGSWLKTINLNEIFNKMTKKWLCYFDKYFWADEKTFYFSVEDYENDAENPEKIYYKLVFKENNSENFSWQDFPKLSFPIKETIKLNNSENFPKLDKIRAAYLISGTYPIASDCRMVGTLDFSDEYTSLIVYFKLGEHEFYNVLINLDKNNQMIDYLTIAYDEVAESAFTIENTLYKDKIILKEINYYSDPPEETYQTYQINDRGQFVLNNIDRK